MTRTAVKMDNERAVITGLIVNTQFCEQIVPIVSRRTFKTHYAKVVSDWAIEHFKEYGEAPQKLIQDIFYQKKHTLGIEEAQSISEFLGSLSKEHSVYTDYNVKYEADKAEEYIKIRNIESVKEELEMAIAEGDPTKGEQAIATFSQVGRPESSGTSILSDTNAILEAFNSQDEFAFTWPEGMKEVIPAPSRGDLCAILATVKSGKSWMLDFIAETAALQGNKVLFVEMEMRHSQVLRRAYQRMTSSPIVDKTVTIPFFKPCFDPEDKSIKEWDKTYELMERDVEKKGLKIDVENVKQVQEDMRLYYRGGDVKYLTYPAYSKTLSYIMAQVDNMIYYENWSPSVVIIDSADLLVPEARSSEIRHQLDDIWKRMRSWAQSRNICLWTVSQGNRASLKGSVVAENIAEDMRKLTHVSLMLGLSRGKEDKAKGIARISSLVQRDGHEVLDEVIITQCLDIGRFYLEGKPSKQVINL